jgi:hypothetical protein
MTSLRAKIKRSNPKTGPEKLPIFDVRDFVSFEILKSKTLSQLCLNFVHFIVDLIFDTLESPIASLIANCENEDPKGYQ